ncbi:ATP-binding protein, partial [Methylopila musalis]
ERRRDALGLDAARLNAHVGVAALEEIARTDAAGRRLLQDAADALKLSARGYHRVLRVARTIADLDGAETVGRAHLAEALAYRSTPAQAARAA